jgi:hypothetical protein
METRRHRHPCPNFCEASPRSLLTRLPAVGRRPPRQAPWLLVSVAARAATPHPASSNARYVAGEQEVRRTLGWPKSWRTFALPCAMRLQQAQGAVNLHQPLPMPRCVQGEEGYSGPRL